jgi:lipoprotein-anchoring transpeptidase ErfK/SrfK
MTTEPRLTLQQLLQYGIRLVQENQPEAARPFFEKMLERDPGNIPALMWLAGLSETPADGYAYIARALTIDPQNERAHAAIRWNHWREQEDRLRAAGFVSNGLATAHRVRKSAAPARTSSAWLSAIAALIVCLGALASIYFGQPRPVSATALQPGAPAAEVARVLPALPTLPTSPTLPPLATRTLPPAATPAPTETPIATPTLPPALLPTATPMPPTETAEPPPATPELPAALPVLPADTPVNVANPTGSSSERWIDVDLTHQELVAYEGDTPVYRVIVSTGLPDTPTVTGQYRIYVKYPAQTMSGPGYYLPDVPYVMYFYQGYGIHGTYWHNNFGHPMSHGCVNTPTPDAQWLYNWAAVGTLVNVHN